MSSVEDLKVKLFADGADEPGMLEMYAKPHIKGFTTNPTLMRKAGISDYRAFAQIELGRSYLVGDRWRDVAAGQLAGCKSLFIDNHYSEREPGDPFVRVSSLLDAAKWILTDKRNT